jgi:hypothetical protein
MNIPSSLGLVSDIIGVVIIFIHGLPSKVDEMGGVLLLGENPKDEQIRKNKNKRITRYAYFGLAFIILGFLLQLIGTNLYSSTCNTCHYHPSISGPQK